MPGRQPCLFFRFNCQTAQGMFTHASSWRRPGPIATGVRGYAELGHPPFFNNRQRWKWVPGQARDDSGFCSSDSTVKQPKGCSPTRRPGEGQDPQPREFVVTPSWASTLLQQSTAVEMGPGSSPGRQPRLFFRFKCQTAERIHVRIVAARCARALGYVHPLERRGRRESRVRAAPAVSCAKLCKETHTSIQVQRKHSGLPCAMGYGLLRALPGDRLVCHRRLAESSAKT
jgi:hypothetical protein